MTRGLRRSKTVTRVPVYHNNTNYLLGVHFTEQQQKPWFWCLIIVTGIQ